VAYFVGRYLQECMRWFYSHRIWIHSSEPAYAIRN